MKRSIWVLAVDYSSELNLFLKGALPLDRLLPELDAKHKVGP